MESLARYLRISEQLSGWIRGEEAAGLALTSLLLSGRPIIVQIGSFFGSAAVLLAGARQRGSSLLLGGAFAVCAAPCIGTVLAAVLVLASDSSTVLKGCLLLAVYSIGLGSAFLLAGVAFARAMSAFRWLRDHYRAIQVVSGTILVALGLLLFFHRDWWLRVLLNRALQKVGLDNL